MFVSGAIIRYGITSEDVSSMRVKPLGRTELRNGTRMGPPDFLLLPVADLPSKQARKKLLNRTLAYAFKGEVKDVTKVNEVDQKTTFDPEIFFNVLLPPIIFHAGYSMKKRFFFRNIGSIFAFAFVGTAISTFVVGGVTYAVVYLFPHLSSIFTFLDTLHFGAMISATDPVTILAIFNDLSVDVNLYALVFGESVLNDAVAIVLTRTLEDYEENQKTGLVTLSTSMVILKSVGEFLGIFFASFLVGSAIACFTALLTKFTHIRLHPQLESTLFVLMSYSSFLLAEVLDLTGIVAVLFCGICQAHYTYNNLSDNSRVITKEFFSLLNFMAENFIFSYIGVSMFTFPKHKFDAPFILASFVAIILGRAINVYVISFFLNLGRRTKITLNLQHMMFLSGLRGAIAFALSIRNTLTEARQMILTTTLLIVIVTVMVCGGSALSLLTWLGIPLGQKDDEESAPIASPAGSPPGGNNSSYNSVDGGEARAVMQSPPAEKSWVAELWSSFDTKFMKPFLTHSSPTLMETLPSCCLPLGRLLTSQEQLAKHPAMHISEQEIAGAGGFANPLAFNNASLGENGGCYSRQQSSDSSTGGGLTQPLDSPLKEARSAMPGAHI